MRKQVRVKPSKGQSMIGFMAGLIFCGIGLIVVIPAFGPFGIVWTLFAVIITVTNGLNAFTDKGIASHEITVEDDSEPSIMDKRNDPEERLEELQSLYEKGLINYEEYQTKRQQIIKEL